MKDMTLWLLLTPFVILKCGHISEKMKIESTISQRSSIHICVNSVRDLTEPYSMGGTVFGVSKEELFGVVNLTQLSEEKLELRAKKRKTGVLEGESWRTDGKDLSPDVVRFLSSIPM